MVAALSFPEQPKPTFSGVDPDLFNVSPSQKMGPDTFFYRPVICYLAIFENDPVRLL